jgi:hypothetical protein
MIPNQGKCPLCKKTIAEFAPIATVDLGHPKVAYKVHKDCRTPQQTVAKEPELVKAQVTVLPAPGDISMPPLPQQTSAPLDASQLPSMPLPEQAVRKRGRPRRETS